MRPWLIPGRFQPLHEGHIKLIRTLLEEGDPVVLGILDAPKDSNNPYSLEERKAMIVKEFKDEISVGMIGIMTLPHIKGIAHGRNVGYDIREIRLDDETESISGTDIRNNKK